MLPHHHVGESHRIILPVSRTTQNKPNSNIAWLDEKWPVLSAEMFEVTRTNKVGR
jgi:hypothetical protein